MKKYIAAVALAASISVSANPYIEGGISVGYSGSPADYICPNYGCTIYQAPQNSLAGMSIGIGAIIARQGTFNEDVMIEIYRNPTKNYIINRLQRDSFDSYSSKGYNFLAGIGYNATSVIELKAYAGISLVGQNFSGSDLVQTQNWLQPVKAVSVSNESTQAAPMVRLGILFNLGKDVQLGIMHTHVFGTYDDQPDPTVSKSIYSQDDTRLTMYYYF